MLRPLSLFRLLVSSSPRPPARSHSTFCLRVSSPIPAPPGHPPDLAPTLCRKKSQSKGHPEPCFLIIRDMTMSRSLCTFLLTMSQYEITLCFRNGVPLAMRDGIYKTLPLGRGWKSLLRSCEREKERGEISLAKARHAIAQETYAEVSAQFVSALNLHAIRGDSLFEGLNNMSPDLSPRDIGGCNSPFEKYALKNYARLQKESVFGRERVSA